MRQDSMFQVDEDNKTSEKELNKTQIYQMAFKLMAIKMLPELY